MESNPGSLIPLLLASIVVIFLVRRFLRKFKSDPGDYYTGRDSEGPEPQIGDDSQQKAALESAVESLSYRA